MADLTQYVFYDGSEQIADSDGKILFVKNPNTDYLPLNTWCNRYVGGSIESKLSDPSKGEPRENEHLLLTMKFGLFPEVTTSKIKEINRGFKLPQED